MDYEDKAQWNLARIKQLFMSINYNFLVRVCIPFPKCKSLSMKEPTIQNERVWNVVLKLPIVICTRRRRSKGLRPDVESQHMETGLILSAIKFRGRQASLRTRLSLNDSVCICHENNLHVHNHLVVRSMEEMCPPKRSSSRSQQHLFYIHTFTNSPPPLKLLNPMASWSISSTPSLALLLQVSAHLQ